MKTLALLIAFLPGLIFFSKAQKADTITISPLVGNVIDSAERVQFRILYQYSPNDFIRAVFIRNADSSITLRTLLHSFEQASGAMSDSIVERKMDKLEYEWMKKIIERNYIGSSRSVYSNDGLNRGNKLYEAKISLLKGGVEKGILNSVNDSIVRLNRRYRSFIEEVEIPVTDINSIRLVRKNAAGAGVAFGALGGFTIGLMMGIQEGGSWLLSGPATGVGYGLLLCYPGALIGVIVALASPGTNFYINGSEEKYKNIQQNLKTYCGKR